MSLAYTSLAVSGADGFGSPSQSITVPAGALLLVGGVFYSPDGSEGPVASGLTFTAQMGMVGDNMKLWRCLVGGGGFSGTLTLNGALFAHSFGYFTGQNIGGTNGASGIVQTVDGSGTATDPVAKNYPSAFGSATNGGYAMFWRPGGTSSLPRSGWTEQGEDSNAYGLLTVHTRTTSDTACGVDYGTGSTLTPTIIFLEIAEAAAAGRSLFYRSGLDGRSTSGPKQFNPSLG